MFPIGLLWRGIVLLTETESFREANFAVTDGTRGDGYATSQSDGKVGIMRLSGFRTVTYSQTSKCKMHQIPKLRCFSSRLAVVFAQSIEVRC